MPYRIETGEPARDALRRSAREQLESAIDALAGGIDVDPVTAVHDARKSLKKARSLLRLGRAALHPVERRCANAAFRAAAQELGARRDADVMSHALDDLAARYTGHVPHATFEAIRERLDERRAAMREQGSERDSGEQVSQDLRAALMRIEDWQLREGGWDPIGDGLRRGYRRGRTAFQRARVEPTVENLHDWRKRVKDLWYHLRWLGPILPATMSGHAQDAHHLSELLGDDHDLAVLRESLNRVAGEIPADLEPV
jgi:CHAD domain-containing protein